MEVYMYLCISMYIYIYTYILCTHIICTIDCQSHYHMLFVSRACNAQIMANMCLFAWSKLELEDVRLTLFLATKTLSHRKRAPATALRGRCRAHDYDKSGTRISELGGGDLNFRTTYLLLGEFMSGWYRFNIYYLTRRTNLSRFSAETIHWTTHFYVTKKTDHSQSQYVSVCWI